MRGVTGLNWPNSSGRNDPRSECNRTDFPRSTASSVPTAAATLALSVILASAAASSAPMRDCLRHSSYTRPRRQRRKPERRSTPCLPYRFRLTSSPKRSRTLGDMVDPIKLPIPTPPPNADAHARADTERNRRLFDWAEAVLKALGLDKAVAAARSIEESAPDHARRGQRRDRVGAP